MSPKVSLIIPGYNCRDFIEPFMESVFSMTYPDFEVIFVDGYSTDGSVEFIKGKYGSDDRLKVLQSHKGLAGSRNDGIKIAQGEYLAFIETDMEMEPDWLGKIVALLKKDKSLGGGQSKVVDFNNRDVLQAVGIKIIPQTGWVKSLGMGKSINDAKYNKSSDVCIGAVGSVVRKEVIDKVGGFDGKLVHNLDDPDLGWRIWIGGYRIITVPDAVTYHWTDKPWSLRKSTIGRLRWEFHFNKSARLLIKNLELLNVIKFLPISFVILGIRSLINLFRFNPYPFLGLTLATLWNMVELPDTLRERRRIQKKVRKVSDEYIFKKIMVRGSFLDIYKRDLNPTFKVLKRGLFSK